MKVITFTFAAIVLLTSTLSAQWITRDYTLISGWNGVWLAGDASHTTVADIFADYPEVTEVWRWNPNPDQILFTTNPSAPSTSSEEWTVWKRNDIHEQMLKRMVGNSAYLIRSTAARTVPIKQLALPPAATWLITGANFLGFPAAGNGTASSPTFNAYFSSYPSASTTVLDPGSPIYRYIGGELSPANPMLVNTSTERLDPKKAYWFQFPTVSNFTAPVEYELPSSAGLAFGRTRSAMTVGVTNRSTANMVLTITLEASEPAPAGQRGIAGDVALTRRIFNSETNSFDEIPLSTSGAYTVTVPASGRMNLDFGIDRSEMDTHFSYASLLRIRDGNGFTDVSLPVSAEAPTTAGLWGVKVRVNDVVSTVPDAPGTSTSQPFPLRFLIHVNQDGEARMLSQAFVGQLTSAGNPLGITISETEVLPYNESDIKPRRYVAAQLPLDQAIAGMGAVSTGATASWVINIDHDDVTNPFVHTYHPDHDNLDATFENRLPSGVESYTVNRTCDFTFTSSPPDGSTITGWGNTILGGIYTETLTGLNRQSLHVSGTFTMARISEIGEIDLTQPSD
ncbi:MAG: hypothetical protein JJU20_10770 [Opitutales bacterium]|nr:hypothetical protein [Opitutales bacterium]